MKFYYGLDRDYDYKRNCEDYIAFLFGIQYKDKDKGLFIPAVEEKDSYFVSATQNKTHNTVANGYYSVDPNKYRMLPMMRQNIKGSDNIQRDIFVITASSGSGKTTLINRISEIYRGINPDNQIFFISSKNMAIDPSFNDKLFAFISFDDFMEEFTDDKIEEFRVNNMFENSLIIFDDIVLDGRTAKGKEVKNRFWKIMTIILNLKRMNYLSMIYCCHETSDYSYTRILFNEMTGYITFNTDLKNRSNLIYKEYLKLEKAEIDKITSMKSRWVAILTRPRCILSETEIIAIK